MKNRLREPVPGLALYGLYDVVADCFLLVLNNIAVAQRVKYLVSSRYHLHVCRLDTATNYVADLITNNNCEHWSLTNRDHIRFADPVSTDTVAVTELCATRETAPQYNVYQEKQWCWFCAHCLYYLHNERDNDGDFEHYYWQYSKLDDYLNSFLDIQQVQYHKETVTAETRQAILKMLYLGRDLDATRAQIKQLVNFV